MSTVPKQRKKHTKPVRFTLLLCFCWSGACQPIHQKLRERVAHKANENLYANSAQPTFSYCVLDIGNGKRKREKITFEMVSFAMGEILSSYETFSVILIGSNTMIRIVNGKEEKH